MNLPQAAVQILEDSDLPDLLEFLVQFPGETRSRHFWEQRLKFWWETNPAYATGYPRGWILKKKHTICGFLAAIPGNMIMEGSPTRTTSIGIWRVTESHRHQSLKLLWPLLAANQTNWILSCTHNPTVGEILTGLKFTEMPGGYTERSGTVLNISPYLQRKWPWTRRVKPLLSLVDGARRRVLTAYGKSRLKQADSSGFTFASEPKGLDLLGESVPPQIKFTNRRSEAQIYWQLRHHPLKNRLYLGLHQEGKLRAYLLFQRREKPPALPQMECIDFWGEPCAEKEIRILLSAAHLRALEAGVDLLTIPHYQKNWPPILKKMGFRKFSMEGMRFLIKPPRGADPILTESTSYFVLQQGDYGL